jgi:hypothetical protein
MKTGIRAYERKMREKKVKIGRGQRREEREGGGGSRLWSGAVWESGELVMI